MEYTISILLLPMLTFLVLGLFGMKLRPNTAGYIGSLSLAVTTGLAYITAGLYFSAPRVDGVFARIMPVDFEWHRSPPHRSGYIAGSDFCHDAGGHHNSIADGTYL